MRKDLAALFLAVLVCGPTMVAGQEGVQAPSAAERMQASSPEIEELIRRTGTWSVVSTVQLAPDATPIVTRGLVAERTMVGRYMQEVMHPAAGDGPDFRRLAFQYYDRIAGRWQYVSMDTRFPVGIMPARSVGPADGRVLRLEFDDIAFVGLGREVEGRMLHSNLVITRDTDDHELVQQDMITADGTGRQWRAVTYEYTRRREVDPRTN
jgi:hypothetical protein